MARRVEDFPPEAGRVPGSEAFKAKIERLEERERDFALRLGVTDGGRYKNDWYSRIDALLKAEAQAAAADRLAEALRDIQESAASGGEWSLLAIRKRAEAALAGFSGSGGEE